MKLKYIMGLFLIVLISGCATAPTTPPAGDVTAPAEEVTTPEPVETVAEAVEEVAEVPAGADVQILKNAFEPAKLTVKAGATVSFKNMDTKRHSLTFKGVASSQGSGNIEPGKIYEHTFEKAGTYTVMAIPGAFKAEITVG